MNLFHRISLYLTITLLVIVFSATSLVAQDDTWIGLYNTVLVNISSTPSGATVFCTSRGKSERRLGTASSGFNVRLLVGEYSFRFSLPNYEPFKKDVKLSDRTATVEGKLVPLPAKLKVIVHPNDASITVDGKTFATNKRPHNIDAGRHYIVAQHPLFKTERSIIDALPGELMTVKIKLDPLVKKAPPPTKPAEPPKTRRTGHGILFAWCPPGKFTMGSPLSEKGRSPNEWTPYTVTIKKGFWLSVYEITNQDWHTLGDGKKPQKTEARFPVVNVSFDECHKICTPLGLRFPTEEEWEYACRAGSSGPHYGVLNDIAWTGKNSGERLRQVGCKAPNNFGIYDMLGNAYEWCKRGRGRYYHYPPRAALAGPTWGGNSVERGGSWKSNAARCRAAARCVLPAKVKSPDLGLRLILEAPAP